MPFEQKHRIEIRTTINKFNPVATRVDGVIGTYYELVRRYRILIADESEELIETQEPLIKWGLTKQEVIDELSAELDYAVPSRAEDIEAMIETLENEV